MKIIRGTGARILAIVGAVVGIFSTIATFAFFTYLLYWVVVNPEILGSWIHRLLSSIKS
jgi:hypothetical protein